MSVRLLHRIAAHPLVYDWIQRGAGYAEVSGRVVRCLPTGMPATVLDVGAGTGNLRRVVPDVAIYIWLDNDPVKLNGFLGKGSRSFAMLSDAPRLAVRDRGVDYVVCVDMSHHLTDDQLAGMMREFSRGGAPASPLRGRSQAPGLGGEPALVGVGPRFAPAHRSRAADGAWADVAGRAGRAVHRLSYLSAVCCQPPVTEA